ncbi:cysteine-rich CWC family protein [Vibrio kasasachensis]|uniref:cysteine-rich CWC family protein n=1 Tax=Vibrio kasasachensis TaxID=2910248 RepID=UPI003D145CD6
MKSPCIAACKNNAGMCSGCHRTMNELTAWRELSEDQQSTRIAEIMGITSTHSCPSCQEKSYCDISAGKSTCWCFEIEKRDLSNIHSNEACLCRKCLSLLPID